LTAADSPQRIPPCIGWPQSRSPDRPAGSTSVTLAALQEAQEDVQPRRPPSLRWRDRARKKAPGSCGFSRRCAPQWSLGDHRHDHTRRAVIEELERLPSAANHSTMPTKHGATPRPSSVAARIHPLGKHTATAADQLRISCNEPHCSCALITPCPRMILSSVGRMALR